MMEITRVRALAPFITRTMPEKMVFIGGPRQVGKTTLAREIGKQIAKNKYSYLNWDISADRRTLLKWSFTR